MNDNKNLNNIFDSLGKFIDINNAVRLYNRCIFAINNYNRKDSIAVLQEAIKKYENEIKNVSIFTNITVNYCNYDKKTDREIVHELKYIANNIPVYECLKQGKKDIANRILEYYLRGDNNDTCNKKEG